MFAAFNTADESIFIFKYALVKLTLCAEICNRNRSGTKFLRGSSEAAPNKKETVPRECVPS